MSGLQPDQVLLEVLGVLSRVDARQTAMSERLGRIEETVASAIAPQVTIQNELAQIRVDHNAESERIAPMIAAAEAALVQQAAAAERRGLTVGAVTETITGGNRLGSVLIALLTGLVTWYLSTLGATP